MNTLCFYSPYCHRFVSKLLSVAPTIHKTTAANGSKTQGFNIYWIWTNVLHAAHWSCSVMGKCRVLVSTQRHTVQSGSAGSAGSAGTRRQNEAAKRREGGKLLRGIFDPLALTKHHKYPSELATQQHAWGLYLLKLSDTHTPPKNGTPWQERHLFLNLVLLFLWKRKAPTYTHPLISDSLLEGLKHLKRRQWDDRGGNKMGGGYKSRFTRPVPAPVSNFILSEPLQQTQTCTRTHMVYLAVSQTHTLMYFSPDV